MRLGLAWDNLFLGHRAPPGHPEREDRLPAVLRGIRKSRIEIVDVGIRDATLKELELAHTQELVGKIAQTAGRSGYLDADTYYSDETFAAVRRASGACLRLLDALQRGECDYGFAAVRPPGHHACRDRAMGFCLLNHVAVAAAAALQRGTQRVLILDFDVHHGNGTQDIFYEDPRVLYVSLHQSPQYPGTGHVAEQGNGPGYGYTVNIPLSAGANDAVYQAAFARIVNPIVRAFCPQLTLVSAGYDAHEKDPLGGMKLSDAAYGEMTRDLLSSIPDAARGKLLFVLEGGYALSALESATEATVNALVPTGAQTEATGPRPLPARFDQEIERCIAALNPVWGQALAQAAAAPS